MQGAATEGKEAGHTKGQTGSWSLCRQSEAACRGERVIELLCSGQTREPEFLLITCLSVSLHPGTPKYAIARPPHLLGPAIKNKSRDWNVALEAECVLKALGSLSP